MDPMKNQSYRKSPFAFPAAIGPPLEQRGAIHRGRILVADDMPEIRHLVSRFLSRHGYEVSRAENGREAWRMFRRDPYDLVITDLQMPVMDGAALMARIKTRAPETPVVVITGQGGEAVRDMLGGNSQAEAVLPKPFNFETLLKTVKILMDTETAEAAITITV
jgi:DNA-binding response OmpR family regulator